jgi:hypothetical protein
MFHSSGFAIAAGVVAIGAAAASSAVSISAADRAAKAAAGAGRTSKKQLKDLQKKIAAIPTPKWDLARDIKDAGQVTDYNIAQLEQIFPGAQTQREIASRATESYLRGEIPKDVQDQIMRSVAELGGAGFQPTTTQAGQGPSGFQAAQGLLSRQLGQTSMDIQMIGQSLSQGWQQLSGAFIESPLQVGQARLGYEKAAADIELAKLGMIQEGALQQYGISMNTIGSRLAAQQAIAGGIQSIGSATSGALMGVGGAYGQMAMAQGAPAASAAGGYATRGAASQAAPYAASISNVQGMGYVPRAQPAPSASRALTGAYG